jgi:hypothetical protein
MVTLFLFHHLHGHTRVPVDSEFGKWVERQRSKWLGVMIHNFFVAHVSLHFSTVKGYHGPLQPERYLRLHALNFHFHPNHLFRPLRVTDIPSKPPTRYGCI